MESHGESSFKKEKKTLRLGKTEPKAEAEADETQHRMIMEFKSQGQKLTEKEKSKKVLLKKLQKLRRLVDEPKSEVATTTKMIEPKEVKTELPADTVVMENKKTSQTEGCVNKDDAEWYQENINDVFNQLKSGLLQDNQLHVLVKRFTSDIRKSMQHIKLQPEIGLAEIQDIVDMIADKKGTALKSFLRGELVLSKDMWLKLIKLKFGVTVNQGEQITKQHEEGIYMWNAKTPEEESYLRNKIIYIFKHRSKAHEHNAKSAEGLAVLAQKMDSLSDFYVVTQAATVDGIVLNSPLIDRMLMNQRINKNRQDELLQEHSTHKAVEETCLPTMKEEWIESFKPTHQLAVTVMYFMRKNLFKEASVESIVDEFKLIKQQMYKLAMGKKFKGGKAAK